MILKLKTVIALITLLIGSSLFFSSAVQAQRIQTEFDVRLVAEGLKFPWGMAFMPDGNVLVTEKIGQLRIITPDGRVSEPIKGVPAVFFQQQGGLLRKVLILTLGSLVVLLGIVLMPLPGPGLLIVFIGATLIAEESEVAARLLDRIDLRLQPLNRRWKRWRAERRRKRKT